MSVDYYLSFEPLGLSRQSVLQRVLEILFDLESRVDADYFRLNLKDGFFEYTRDEIECPSLVAAIDQTSDWDGVQGHFTYGHHMCYLLILNDIPGNTTVAIGMPGSLFEGKRRNSVGRAEFLDFVERSIGILGARFCVFEPEWENRSRTLSDINAWIEDVAQGVRRDWELLVVDDELISRNQITTAIAESEREQYSFAALGQRRWLLLKGKVFPT